MVSTTLERPDKFRIGRVFNNSFAVIGRNPGLLVGLAALFSALPALVLNFWNYRNFANLDFANPESMAVTDPSAVLGNSSISIAFGLIYFVLALLFQSSLVRATIEDLNGKRPAIGDCIQIALRCMFPTLGIALVVFLTMIFAVVVTMFVAGLFIPVFGAPIAFIAFIALLVPGIMLLLGVSVSIPVLIQERLGVFGSMSRSRALTKGSRWSLFGLLLILFLAVIAIQMAFALVFGLAFALTGSLSTVGLIVGAIGSAVVSTVVSTVISVAIAVSYVELRQVKEGTGIDELAEIFS
ncbi:hypothetical protein [Mesorhizobium escarrei]|uniref:DUF7847 domain-containing protein n=1 Tax=Mesorhizobium escarrei TaxID=666018 RepID=A0ABM9DZL5_9HYPH|nr:hypothetical protein [Mesorhizobium escarrei]CAH2402243.1 conserved membrane hypothetical protein [Mesorhizobium escarrei]